LQFVFLLLPSQQEQLISFIFFLLLIVAAAARQWEEANALKSPHQAKGTFEIVVEFE
jgi:hypothetical protein